MKLARKLLLAAAISSCSSTVLVEVSPRMVLDREKTIGIVAFDVQGSESGALDVTSRFVEALQEGQPGIPVIELGSSAEVLAAAGRTRLDAEALRAIGEKFDVDRVIVGTLTLQESKPKVDVSLGQVFESGSLHAQVRLDGSLDAKLFDTERGATLWTGSSSRWIELASMSGSTAGFGSIGVADRERQIDQLVYDMVQETSCDFRPTWERRPAP